MHRGRTGALSFLQAFEWRIGFLCLFQSLDHGVQRGIENNRRMAQRTSAASFRFPAGVPLKKIAAMEFHGEIGIFEQVSGKDQNHGLFGLHKALLH